MTSHRHDLDDDRHRRQHGYLQRRQHSGITLDAGERDEQTSPRRNAVGPGFFRTIGVRLREGREFAATDAAASQPVAIVNEAFVRRYSGNASALGRRIGPAGPRGSARFTIVGVTRDSKTTHVRDALLPFWYVYAQLDRLSELTLHVRARESADAGLRDIRQAIASIDGRVAVGGASTLRDQIEEQVEMERLLATLAGTFAILALFLASLGLYSTVSYLTTARTREIGIRMALGSWLRPRAAWLPSSTRGGIRLKDDERLSPRT